MASLHKKRDAIIEHLVNGLELEPEAPQLRGVELVIWPIQWLKPGKENKHQRLFNKQCSLCNDFLHITITKKNQS